MRIVLYILIATVSFTLFLIAFAPASPAWVLIRDDVKTRVPDLNIFRVGGTVWTGEAEIQFRDFPPSTLSWDVHAAELIGGQLKADLTLIGEDHHFATTAVFDEVSGAVQQLSGNIGSEYVNQVSRKIGLTFSGELIIDQVNLTADDRQVRSIDGVMHWTGGRTVLAISDEAQVVAFPRLDGKLYFENAEILLDVTSASESLLTVTLKQTGWAVVAIKARTFDLANMDWQGNGDLDQTVLLIEEKIL